jgi:hypothetical protein
MQRISIVLLGAGLTCSVAAAQTGKEPRTRFWNLTANTVQEFYLSSAGKNEWGPNQCKNDKDGEVDHRERPTITGVQSGHYDARLIDRKGRSCIVRNIEIKEGAVFSIEENQLKNCTRR